MPTFALIGAAGYVAPRHMQAIHDVGGELVAALDPHDSVGILDRYSPGCLYFREPERFDRWLSKSPVDYVVVCSPNYLHDCHSLMAMRNGCNVICEKPLVCNERNLDNLAEWEVRTGKKVSAILQCRLHPEAIKARTTVSKASSVTIEYRVPRGLWYAHSWKGDVEKSGGLATNIGVHLVDLVCWLFDGQQVVDLSVITNEQDYQDGYIYFDKAQVCWQLSTKQGAPKRVFSTNLGDIDLTNGFTDLHTESYRKILCGEGFGIEDARPSIRIVEAIRGL